MKKITYCGNLEKAEQDNYGYCCDFHRLVVELLGKRIKLIQGKNEKE